MYLNYERKVAAGRVRMVNVPHNVAIAAMRLESLVPETHGFPAVKAWVESGGDVNGIFDPDAHTGGREGCHMSLRHLEAGGEPLLSLAIGGAKLEGKAIVNRVHVFRDRRRLEHRLALIRYLLARGADPNFGKPMYLVAGSWCEEFRLRAGELLIDAGANLEAATEHGYTPLARALDLDNYNNMEFIRLLLRRGASLDFPGCNEMWMGLTRNTAETLMQSQLRWFAMQGERRHERTTQKTEERLRLVTAVRAAGSWKSYLRTPHKSLLRLRSLLARGRARRRPLWAQPTPHFLVRLFDPSLPNGVFWHALSYWRETG